MKHTRTMSVLAGLAMLVVMVPMFAQNTWNGEDFEAKFTVPMAFYAGDKLMPAGTYEVRQNATDQNALLIRGKGKNEAFVQFQAIASSEPIKSVEVTFNKYGDKEFLNSIKLPAGGGGKVTQTSFVLKLNPSTTEQAAAKAAAAAAHSVPGTATTKKKQ